MRLTPVLIAQRGCPVAITPWCWLQEYNDGLPTGEEHLMQDLSTWHDS